jgi:hypothetical protein
MQSTKAAPCAAGALRADGSEPAGVSGESATGNLARSGQGYLSPLRCYAARGLSTSPLAMHCVNLALAVAGVFVFVRWAPLGRAHRPLFVLGYFPFYEVAVLSRSSTA